jgi:hypothetical protein
MLEILAKIFDDGGPLVSVTYLLFEGDARFITAVGLRFGLISAVFRAIEADDTLAVSLVPLARRQHETSLEATSFAPWNACSGLGIRWAWRLTNQQGYSDGVRLEFGNSDEASSTVVELIVVASAIQTFVVAPSVEISK